MVLSVTLRYGSNVKYPIKSPKADTLDAATKERISKQKVSSYEISQLGTAPPGDLQPGVHRQKEKAHG